jgi:antagonist of KipI
MIEILRSGIQTSVQDLGCGGMMHLGLPRGGAADQRSLKAANQILGNIQDQPCLECTIHGPTIRFHKKMLVAVAGASADIRIDKQFMPMHTVLLVQQGQVLSVGAIVGGFRCYLAFNQVLDIEPINSCAATFIAIGIGGYKGRALKSGDSITFNDDSMRTSTSLNRQLHRQNNEHDNRHWLSRMRATDRLIVGVKRYSIRIFAGVDSDLLDSKQWQSFLESRYEVNKDSNRMGIRLDAPSVALCHELQMVSSAILCGTIQLPADGQPIIAHVEAQTIGGYPRIGQVVAQDIASLGQLKAGDSVNFVLVDSK